MPGLEFIYRYTLPFLDAMKMNCFFQLNKEKLQNQWDEAGLASLYYIITVLLLFFIFLGLTILMETYKVENKLNNVTNC